MTKSINQSYEHYKSSTHEPLIIVDGFGFVFRAYHVQPPLTAPDGRPVGAIYGFTSMLLKLINDFKPREAVIVLDSPGKNFRHDIYPAYKANRPPAPENLIKQLKLIRVAAEALNFKVLEKPGYEADDIIATLAKQASTASKNTVIVSSDKDLMQLIDDHVQIYDAAKGRFLGYEDVENKFGVGPKQVRDVQALIGDVSDNIPGIRGIGPKTASDLIKEFSGLEGIYRSLDKITSASKRAKIEAGMEDAFLSWKLVGLDDAVDLELNYKECVWTKPSENQIGEFLLNNGFKSLIKRTQKILSITINDKSDIQSNTDFSDHSLVTHVQVTQRDELSIRSTSIDRPEQLREIINLARAEGMASIYLDRLDISKLGKAEGSQRSFSSLIDNSVSDELCSSSSSSEDLDFPREEILLCINVLNRLLIISARLFRQYDKFDKNSEYFVLLKEFFEDKSIKKITYDLKKLIKYFDILDVSAAEDLMLMDYALSAGKRIKTIPELISEYLSIDILSNSDTYVLADKGNRCVDIHQELSTYRVHDPVSEVLLDKNYTRMDGLKDSPEDFLRKYRFLYYFGFVYNKLKQELISQKIYHIYASTDLAICYILVQMETLGIKIDRPGLARLSLEFQEKICDLEAKIYENAGEKFNISSTKQLGEVLFDKMHLPFKKASLKSGGYSTSSEILDKLSAEGHAIADLILDYRHLSKLKNTYADVLPNLAWRSDSRIHTTYQQNQTSTSRLTSKDPNLQNIPIRTEAGNKIRRCFVAKEGHKLISADYSQIELRILSHVANVKELQKAFIEDQDIHKKTASQIFHIPVDAVDSDLRRKAKAINFGIIYGISPFGLSKQLNCSKEDAASYIERYFDSYPGIEAYMKNTIAFAKQTGFVVNILGRKSYIPLINNKNYAMRSYGERAAINAPLQSLNADIVKIAMINLVKAFRDNGLATRMLLQIHDELVFEAPCGEVDVVTPLIKVVMENAIKISVPMRVDISSGDNLQELR